MVEIANPCLRPSTVALGLSSLAFIDLKSSFIADLIKASVRSDNVALNNIVCLFSEKQQNSNYLYEHINKIEVFTPNLNL